jgi:TolB-like protein
LIARQNGPSASVTTIMKRARTTPRGAIALTALLASAPASCASQDRLAPPVIVRQHEVVGTRTSWDAAMSRLAHDLSSQLTSRGEAQRTRIAVLDLTNAQGVPCGLGGLVAEELTTRLFLQRGVDVIERRRLQQILAEQRLEATDLIDPDTAARVGRILGVHALVSGSIVESRTETGFFARLVATETGTILAASSADALTTEVLPRGRCLATADVRMPIARPETTRPDANEAREATQPRAIVQQTFANVPIGEAPSSWLGVDNFMVVDLGRGRRALHCFRPGPTRIQIPVGRLPEAYVVEVQAVIGELDWFNVPTFSLGDTTWLFNNRSASINATSVAFEPPRAGVVTSVALERRRNLYRLYIDGREIVLERHVDRTTPSSLVIDLHQGGDVNCNRSVYELRSVLIRALD